MEKKKASAFLTEQATSISKAIAFALEAQGSSMEEGSEDVGEELAKAIKALEQALICSVNCGREY